jgi:phospholipase C
VKLPLILMHLALIALAAACSGTHSSPGPGAQTPAPAGGLFKVNHIIIVMMENHSFDNYFGALAYAPGSPYHTTVGGCSELDHACVDGLACRMDSVGSLTCTNSNQEANGTPVVAFHDVSRCVVPDLAHSWLQVHLEANFNEPNAALFNSPNDGFVRINDAMDQPDNSVETPTEDQTMGFYTQDDLPLYYDLAQKFAVDDRYFSSLLGPTLPNRFYLMAATSFGHLTTADPVPPGGYKPITGTIFDLLDNRQVSWADYFQDAPQAGAFRQTGGAGTDPHFFPVQDFLTAAAGASGAGELPQVALIDPGFAGPDENDEHPPTDIQRGQAFVSRLINAVRNGPYWKDSVIFITYDEHGGFYDHVAPPPAPQGSARTPDGISPGQCADLSNPPASREPGGGADCTSLADAQSLCPVLAQNPNGPYAQNCASFDSLGFRVPFLVVSPFAKPHYVSHTIADHTSLLAFIEERFLSDAASGAGAGSRPHLTLRDQYADTLMDLFDFDNAPSRDTSASQAELPATDCTPVR